MEHPCSLPEAEDDQFRRGKCTLYWMDKQLQQSMETLVLHCTVCAALRWLNIAADEDVLFKPDALTIVAE